MPLQVWVRGRRKNTRALARLVGPGRARLGLGLGLWAKGARTRRAHEWPAKNPVQFLRERGFLLQICFATSNLLRISRVEFWTRN
jgi:hypothetical protein